MNAILCLFNVFVFLHRQKVILGLIYFRTSDFKSLSTVATVPDHQSNKRYWGWDSFDTRNYCSVKTTCTCTNVLVSALTLQQAVHIYECNYVESSLQKILG